MRSSVVSGTFDVSLPDSSNTSIRRDSLMLSYWNHSPFVRCDILLIKTWSPAIMSAQPHAATMPGLAKASTIGPISWSIRP